MNKQAAFIVLSCINCLIWFYLGRLSAPPKLPRPGHTWIGFDHANHAAYYVNNGTDLKLISLAFSCDVDENKPKRSWVVKFEEWTMPVTNN